MQKLKKIIAFVLVLCCCFTLFSCSKNVENQTTTSTTTTIKQTTTFNVESTTKGEEKNSQKATEKITTEATTKEQTTTTKTSSTSTTKEAKTTVKSSTTKQKLTAKSTTKLTTTKTTTKSKKDYCTLTIQCKEILGNMNDLKDGHSDFVPSNGYILTNYKHKSTSNETAYDVLKEACKSKNIKLTESKTVYGIYVVGINNLDEKDCGMYSGWKYKVNGVAPNKACDKYEISNGDKIEFYYVCTY